MHWETERQKVYFLLWRCFIFVDMNFRSGPDEHMKSNISCCKNPFDSYQLFKIEQCLILSGPAHLYSENPHPRVFVFIRKLHLFPCSIWIIIIFFFLLIKHVIFHWSSKHLCEIVKLVGNERNKYCAFISIFRQILCLICIFINKYLWMFTRARSHWTAGCVRSSGCTGQHSSCVSSWVLLNKVNH